jgi:hypothetical protein
VDRLRHSIERKKMNFKLEKRKEKGYKIFTSIGQGIQALFNPIYLSCKALSLHIIFSCGLAQLI